MTETKKWMPFYVSDYLADTTHLSTAEHGAYMLILLNLWQTRRPIKDSDEAFQRVSKATPEAWAKMRDVILELLTKTADGWIQKRLWVEIERAEKAYKKRVKTVKDLNNKRRGLPRSSRDNRNDERHDDRDDNRNGNRDDDRPTTTLSKERVVVAPSASVAQAGTGRVPSDPPARPPKPSADQDPYSHGFLDKQNRVVVHQPDGVILKISETGAVDLIAHDREAVIPQLTTEQALELRASTLRHISEPVAKVLAAAKSESFDPIRDMPACLRRAQSLA